MIEHGAIYRDYWMQAVAQMWRMDTKPLDRVQDLVDIVAPPVSQPPRDWSEVERRLGIRLPSDYSSWSTSMALASSWA